MTPFFTPSFSPESGVPPARDLVSWSEALLVSHSCAFSGGDPQAPDGPELADALRGEAAVASDVSVAVVCVSWSPQTVWTPTGLWVVS